MELNTFGAICRFAIDVEKEAAAYYERAAEAGVAGQVLDTLTELFRAHRKRQQSAEQMRRELVTEMILEPIHGLHDENWQLHLSGSGWQQAVELEGKIRGFYSTAAPLVSISQAARLLRKLAEESCRLEEKARQLP